MVETQVVDIHKAIEYPPRNEQLHSYNVFRWSGVRFSRDVVIEANADSTGSKWKDCEAHPYIVLVPCPMTLGMDSAIAE